MEGGWERMGRVGKCSPVSHRAGVLSGRVSCTFCHLSSLYLHPHIFPIHSHRIKQPALKLHGNKDSTCKPCHMAQLASVCGSDGHTYSSVVRSLGRV